MHFFNWSRWTVTFYIGPPPRPVTCTWGPLRGHPGKCHQQPSCLHLKRYLHFTQSSSLFVTVVPPGSGATGSWVNLQSLWPLGPSPWALHRSHMLLIWTTLNPQPLKDDSTPIIWLKSIPCWYLQKEDETVTFYKGLHRGLLGPPWELPWTTLSSDLHLISVIYTLHNLTILLLDLEKKMFEICMVLKPFGALPLGPHERATHTHLNNFESPTPKDDSCQVWLKSNHAFSRRRWKCKKFTDDGRKRTAIDHSMPSAQVS